MIRDKCFVYQVFTNRQAQIRIGKHAEKSQKRFANPILVAQNYRSILDADDNLNQAKLAKREGVSRARVTQILNLLDLDQDIQDYVCGLADTDLRFKVLTDRSLRELVRLPPKEQRAALQLLVSQQH